jgi:chaperone modulatory protein CbpM
MSRRYTWIEACDETGAERTFLVHCLKAQWVQPAFAEEAELDDADLARLRLIISLREDFGVNDEAVPVILHILDQLHRG